MQRLGRTSIHLHDGYFTQMGIEKLGENYLRKPPCFDQSDLCRFLVTQFSSENCQRHLKVLRQEGFLEEVKTSYGSLVLHSSGILEALFAKHLEVLDDELGNGMQHSN